MLTITPQRASPIRRTCSAITRERILNAALHEFAREGYARATVRGIATRAAISDAAIYYHFATKEDLFRQLVDTRLTPYSAEDEQPESSDICRTMLALVQRTIELLRDDGELLILILREALTGNALALSRYASLLRGWESHAAEQLRRFESSGQLEPEESIQIARQIIYAVIMSFEDMLLLRPDTTIRPWERTARARQSITLCIEQLATGLAVRRETQPL